MKKIYFIILSCICLSGKTQTLLDVLDSLNFHEVKSFEGFPNLISKIELTNKKGLIGYKDSIFGEKMVFNFSTQTFIFINSTIDGTIVAFNVYNLSGKCIFYWEIESKLLNGHRITFYRKRKKKTFHIGCQKGRSCKFYGFSNNLFTGETISKDIDEFNLMLKEIISRY
jgi:hypothetical protein